MSLPSIGRKALPKGRPSSSNKISNVPTLPIITNSLDVIANVVIRVLSEWKATKGSNVRDIIGTIKDVKMDRDFKQRVEQTARQLSESLPDNTNFIDNNNEDYGTLTVARAVHKALSLPFKQYTNYEARLLMIEVIKGNIGKDQGCKELGISEKSIYNYFQDIGLHYMKLDVEDCSVKSIRKIYAELDDNDDDERLRKELMLQSIRIYKFPVPGRPSIHLASFIDALQLREAKKSDFGTAPSNRKTFKYTALELSKRMADSCERLSEDPTLSLIEKDLYYKKSLELRSFKASASTMRRWEEGTETRVGCNITHDKSSKISQVRAKKGNPLFQELHTRNQLEFFEGLYNKGILKTMRPLAHQISNGDEIGLSDNGKVLPTTKLSFHDGDMIGENRSNTSRIVTANEHNMFWNSIYMACRADGSLNMPDPYLIKQSATPDEIRGDLVLGLDCVPGIRINVGWTTSGYNDRNIYNHFSHELVESTGAKINDPRFHYEDGHMSHLCPEAIKRNLDNGLYNIYLVSQNSTNDQPMDNGPNAQIAACINEQMGLWQIRYPTLTMNQSFINEVVVKALKQYYELPNRVETIKKAFEKTNMFPIVNFWTLDYSDITDSVKSNIVLLKSLKDRVNLCISYVDDSEDLRRLRLISDFMPTNNPTTRNITQRGAPTRFIFTESGYPLDVVHTTTAPNGKAYAQLTNQLANDALHISFVAPSQEVSEMLNKRKEASAVSIIPQEINYNLSNTSVGAFASVEGCEQLRIKQDEKQKENAAKAKRKEDKYAATFQKTIANTRIRQKDIKYFKDNTSDVSRTNYCNVLKSIVDEHVVAFGGKTKDAEKKTIPIATLRITMKTLILNALAANDVLDSDDDSMDRSEDGGNGLMDEDD